MIFSFYLAPTEHNEKSTSPELKILLIAKHARGGVLELFFDGVCGPRSETPTHI